MVARPGLAISDLAQAQRLRRALVLLLLVGVAAIMGPLAGAMVAAGHPLVPLFFIAVLVPSLFWRVRPSPVILLVVVATGFQRFPDASSDAITAKIPLFRSLQDSYSISGAIWLPIELVFGLALLLWIAHAITNRRLTMRASPLGVAVAVFAGMALLTEVLGLARGGVFNISLWELRPFLYLALSYLLASQLLTSRRSLRAVLWALVIGSGSMALLGTERTFTLASVYPRPEAILEHDESFFFGCYILLTLALWAFGQRGTLRRVATALLPFVLIADLGNNRRAAWVTLPATLIALAVICYDRMPERRKLIGWLVGVLLVVGSGYVFAFRNSTGLVAEPAHAIWSQFQADPRDASSNLYRTLENLNLGLDIRSSPLIGEGFGRVVPHPVPVFDATAYDPLINFIPHNNVLYVWLRMGVIGMVTFWFLVGAAVVAACQLARHRDAGLAVFGMLALAAIIAWLVQGWYDMGIVSFRIAIFVGCLLGAMAAAWRLGAEGAGSRARAATVVRRRRPLVRADRAA